MIEPKIQFKIIIFVNRVEEKQALMPKKADTTIKLFVLYCNLSILIFYVIEIVRQFSNNTQRDITRARAISVPETVALQN